MQRESTVETMELQEIDTQDLPGKEHAGSPAESDSSQPDKDNDNASGKDTAETLKEMRRALRETRTALKQTNESARFWMEQARNGGKKEEPAEGEPEATVSVDLVEAVSNNDAKAIKKALQEMGFVSRKEMDRAVSSVVTNSRKQQDAEAKLYEDFPDLRNDKSPMFRLTSEIYNDLAKRDPILAKSGSLASIAAELADKRLAGAERSEPRSRRSMADELSFETDEDDEDEDDREQERVRRVARQSGGGNRRPRQSAGGRDDESLDSTQKTIVAKLKAAGADISEDGYRKRASAGVRMSGLPTRRPRY